jgi:hypothetical protein
MQVPTIGVNTCPPKSLRRTLASLALLVVVVLASSAHRAVGAPAKGKARAQVRAQASKRLTLGEAQSIVAPFVVRSANASLDERGRAALALLRFDYEQAFPGWTISFLPGRQRLLGLTLVGERRIEVYIRKDRSVEGVAHDIAHELGHAADVTYNNEKSRARYLKERGLPADTPWWACNSCRDLEVGAGDFAEVFAHLVAPRFAFYSKLKPAPDARVSEILRTEVLAAELKVQPLSEPAPVPSVPTGASPIVSAPASAPSTPADPASASGSASGSAPVPLSTSGTTLAPVLVAAPAPKR